MLLLLTVLCNAADAEPTTMATYDIEVPGSNPIRIVEGGPLWLSTPPPQRKFDRGSFTTTATSPLFDRNDGFGSNALRKFLSNYAKDVRRNKTAQYSGEQMESVELITVPSEEPSNRLTGSDSDRASAEKSWNLLHFQKHHHPYDDKKGWVSMEPVPWSVSKISKWQSSYHTTQSPWHTNSYDSNPDESLAKPLWATHSFQPYDKPEYADSRPDSRPVFAKPSALYGQKVYVNYNNKIPTNQYKDDNCDHQDASGDIITDGLPPNFPVQSSYESNRRQGTDIHPDNHPFTGQGEWVLLSTTKGYRYPQPKQRSLQVSPDSIGTHRGVRLTVLPPLKNSKVNMTTSHGGLLQVESTFETVDQAHQKYVKKQKRKQKPKRLQKVVKRNKQPQRQVAAPTVTTTRKDTTAADTSAVLAAVGAGMIPATMAMLVPMAMGGRKRRHVKITLPPNAL